MYIFDHFLLFVLLNAFASAFIITISSLLGTVCQYVSIVSALFVCFQVYFAGLGCMKNVRAALSRGRVLKCSRCGKPGATIGCRVDRCPRTYHLVSFILKYNSPFWPSLVLASIYLFFFVLYCQLKVWLFTNFIS